MKKYCLTQCFKRNISKKMQFVIELTVIVLVLAALALIGSIVFALVGIAVQFIVLAINPATGIFVVNPILVGLFSLLGSFLFGAALYYIYETINFLVRGTYSITKNLVLNAVAPEQAECRIFEECKD